MFRLSTDPPSPETAGQTAMWSGDWQPGRVSVQVGCVLRTHDEAVGDAPAIVLPPELAYLAAGDIVRVNVEAGTLHVLFRKAGRPNSLLVTERCNSNCVMCSQPPKPGNDDYLLEEIMEAVSLMPEDTPELGITGGEPTLLGDRFVSLLEHLKERLPRTAVHVLSNGRLLADASLAFRIGAIGHPDLMFGVPLYSDLAWEHDFVVQARGAFEETIRGLLNLARYHVPIELRIVLHRYSAPRLPDLGRFIARNLPFVNHVALMGLEVTGHTPMNLGALWVPPEEYREELRCCVTALDGGGVRSLIYNLPLCVLDRTLWPRAVKSISDWKNVYADVCDGCGVRDQCGGLFVSSARAMAASIKPMPTELTVEGMEQVR